MTGSYQVDMCRLCITLEGILGVLPAPSSTRPYSLTSLQVLGPACKDSPLLVMGKSPSPKLTGPGLDSWPNKANESLRQDAGIQHGHLLPQ